MPTPALQNVGAGSLGSPRRLKLRDSGISHIPEVREPGIETLRMPNGIQNRQVRDYRPPKNRCRNRPLINKSADILASVRGPRLGIVCWSIVSSLEGFSHPM
jgi:hypothetical protein